MTPRSLNNAPQYLQWLAYFAERFGVPVVILLVGGYWLATHVAEPLVQSHIAFLQRESQVADDVMQQQRRLAENQSLLADTQNLIAKTIEKQAQTIQSLEECSKKMMEFAREVEAVHQQQIECLQAIQEKLNGT